MEEPRTWDLCIFCSVNSDKESQTLSLLYPDQAPIDSSHYGVVMCQWLSQNINDDEDVLNAVRFSDEAHFPLNGSVELKSIVFGKHEHPWSRWTPSACEKVHVLDRHIEARHDWTILL